MVRQSLLWTVVEMVGVGNRAMVDVVVVVVVVDSNIVWMSCGL